MNIWKNSCKELRSNNKSEIEEKIVEFYWQTFQSRWNKIAWKILKEIQTRSTEMFVWSNLTDMSQKYLRLTIFYYVKCIKRHFNFFSILYNFGWSCFVGKHILVRLCLFKVVNMTFVFSLLHSVDNVWYSLYGPHDFLFTLELDIFVIFFCYQNDIWNLIKASN